MLIGHWRRLFPAVILVFAGCTGQGKDLVAAGKVTGERIDSPQVTLSPPMAFQEAGVLVVCGEVKHQTGMIDPDAAHLDLTVKAPDGKELLRCWVNWFPRWIPHRSPATAFYKVRMGPVPKEGSVIQIRVCSDRHETPPAKNGV